MTFDFSGEREKGLARGRALFNASAKTLNDAHKYILGLMDAFSEEEAVEAACERFGISKAEAEQIANDLMKRGYEFTNLDDSGELEAITEGVENAMRPMDRAAFEASLRTMKEMLAKETDPEKRKNIESNIKSVQSNFERKNGKKSPEKMAQEAWEKNPESGQPFWLKTTDSDASLRGKSWSMLPEDVRKKIFEYLKSVRAFENFAPRKFKLGDTVYMTKEKQDRSLWRGEKMSFKVIDVYEPGRNFDYQIQSQEANKGSSEVKESEITRTLQNAAPGVCECGHDYLDHGPASEGYLPCRDCKCDTYHKNNSDLGKGGSRMNAEWTEGGSAFWDINASHSVRKDLLQKAKQDVALASKDYKDLPAFVRKALHEVGAFKNSGIARGKTAYGTERRNKSEASIQREPGGRTFGWIDMDLYKTGAAMLEKLIQVGALTRAESTKPGSKWDHSDKGPIFQIGKFEDQNFVCLREY